MRAPARRWLWSLIVVMCVPAAAIAAPTNISYSIRASFDLPASEIAVDATISVPEAMAQRGATFLLSPAFKVANVSADGNVNVSLGTGTFPFPGVQTIVLAPEPDVHGRVSIHMNYAGTVAPSDDTENEISPRRLELSADSLWYPILSTLNDRFTFDADFEGAGDLFIIASPDTVSMHKNGFALHRTVASQDIAFSASPTFKTARDGALFFYSDDLQSPQAVDYQTNGAKALVYFEHWFGPLPHKKAVVALARRKSGVGYSRPGYLVVADVPLAPDNLWGKVGYVAHELSHNWWSNADFTGEDYWLVESTAEYSALRYMATQLGKAAIAPIIAKKRIRAQKAGPILGHGRPSNDAVYGKGPVLLFDLEAKIGRPALDSVLATLARRETITTADFLKVLADKAGAKAAQDFDAQLRR